MYNPRKQSYHVDHLRFQEFAKNLIKLLDVLFADEGTLPQPVNRSIGIIRVQVRYFLLDDGSVEVLSLDGRTARGFRRYCDPRTGLRDFGLFLKEMKPDFILLDEARPSEPMLVELSRMTAQGTKTVIGLDGFQFQPVNAQVVRYLGRR